MTNVRNIIEAAYARRTANDPDTLATKSELIALCDRLLKSIYARVGKENRRYFGTSAPVVGVAGVWARPADSTAILWVQRANGTRVHIVPFSDRIAEIPPRIYPLGPNFYTVGTADDPTATETLTFFYSKRHPTLNASAEPDHADNELDDTWPEHYNDLLVSKVARYLAIKSGRAASEVEFL